MPQKITRGRKPHYRFTIYFMLVLMLVLFGVTVASYCVFVIQDFKSEKPVEPIGGAWSFQIGASDGKTPSGVLANAVAVRKAEALSKPGGADSGEELPVQNLPAEFGLVPETGKADGSYFDNALFIGDSISLGMKNSGVLPAKNMLVAQNVSVSSLLSGKEAYIPYGGKTPLPLMQAIAAQMPNPGKIYILLGLNSMSFENEYHVELYAQLVQKLKAEYPDAIIYVQSMTPILKEHPKYKNLSSEKINGMNELLKEMAKNEETYYLNVQEALKDENGYLNADFDGGDGVHLLKPGHLAMYQYYKNHVVLEDGTVNKVIKKGE